MKNNTQTVNYPQEMTNERYNIFHFKDARFSEAPLHHHDFFEVYLFINGKVDYRIEGEFYPLKSGDVLFFPPGIFHQPLVSPDKAYERYVLWIDEKYLKSIINDEQLLKNFAYEKHVISSGDRYEVMLGIFKSLIEDYRNADELSLLYSENMLSLILLELSRLSIKNTIAGTIEDTNETIVKVLSYINDNFCSDLSLESIAKTFYLNKYYLSHLFSKTIGTSIYKYILKKRLVYAHELLESGHFPSSACNECGFKEYTSFLKAYKAEYGVPPKYHYIKN